MTDKPAKKKPGIAKKAERKFFHYFNDKSKGRRAVFMGMLAVAPTYFVSGVFNEDASTQRANNQTAVVSMQNYEREIDGLTRVTPTAPASTVEQRATDLATRVILDRNLSENDKYRLSVRFLERTNMPESSTAESLFERAAVRAPYIQNNLSVSYNDPRLTGVSNVDKAKHVLNESFMSSLYDKGSDYFIAYFLFFSFFELRARRVLQKGREKDDKLKQEVRTETAEEKLARLKELITPKNDGGGPKPK